ncbi:MAG: DUF1599 domain-containing protein [Bacteroidetes bacterium]|nr:DUF1599 domain-containing protein [Bacteroidota bacterium]
MSAATITSQQYDSIISLCRDIFQKKNIDYGTSWRIMRSSSITDQIFIKAQRIRSIEQKGIQKVQEDIKDEYVGIINYCIIGLIQLSLPSNDEVEMESSKVMQLFEQEVSKTKTLMENKNHDYGEAWRDMRINTFTDLILMKLFRVKQIEDHQGETIMSEGIDANYRDMLNYAAFALIRLNEK